MINCRIPLTFLILGTFSIVGMAQNSAGVYRCAGDNGVPTYTNNTQGQKGCERISGVEVTTVPAFKVPTSNTRTTTTIANAGPNDFPKIDTDLQKQRDELGRRPILERELRDREERCASLRKETNNGNPLRPASEDNTAYTQRVAHIKTQLERCDVDLTSIRRELATLK